MNLEQTRHHNTFLVSVVFMALMLSAGIEVNAQIQDYESEFKQAEASAQIAGYSLSKVHRWLHEVALPKIDPKTGLYIADERWNYRDTAADCYPFLCWAAWAVDRDALNGPVRAVLHDEQRLCNCVDRIPATYDLEKGEKTNPEYDELIFQASEYVKDGLIAIVEITGPDEWFERMRGIEDDIWKHARVDTPYGKIPSDNVEVNGEQIQALARLFTMTGDPKYLEYAERLADYYLSDENWYPNRLRDHGCEIIGGLGLLLAVESTHNPEKAEAYAKRLRKMFETIVEKGTNEDGMMYNEIEKQRFGDNYRKFSDGWGYNYVGFLCYDMATGTDTFRGQIEKTLRNLKKDIYQSYPWEGESIDGFADSLEGGLYLINRLPVPEAIDWINSDMAKNVIYADAPLETAELWGTMKLQANGVRTVLIHTLMHTQGILARPWRQDLKLGAAPTEEGVAIVLEADKPWEGILEFDIPRHRLYMGFAKDWPRMNTIPEWTTVEPETEYSVQIGKADPIAYTGMQLHNGLAVSVKPNQPLQILVQER